MSLRRTSALLVSAATALSASIVGATTTATAADTTETGTSAGATSTTAAAEMVCRVEAVGILPNGKLLARKIENGGFVAQKTTGTELPYRPTTLAYAGWEQIDGGVRVFYVTTSRDGRPRLLTVTDKDGRARLSRSIVRFQTTGFTPRLLAMGHAGPQVLALEGSVLRQYRIRFTQDERLIHKPRVALRGMDGLKTLSWYSRQKVGGVMKDFFYATTKSGALKQIRVPVRNPGNAKVITVKRRGFRGFTGLSLGRCGDNRSTPMILGINKPANRARWYSLSRHLSPSAKNLTDHGLATPGRNWRIRPTV